MLTQGITIGRDGYRGLLWFLIGWSPRVVKTKRNTEQRWPLLHLFQVRSTKSWKKAENNPLKALKTAREYRIIKNVHSFSKYAYLLSLLSI